MFGAGNRTMAIGPVSHERPLREERPRSLEHQHSKARNIQPPLVTIGRGFGWTPVATPACSVIAVAGVLPVPVAALERALFRRSPEREIQPPAGLSG